MGVTYGRLTIENQKYINEKAKEKIDGIYTARGICYRVRSGFVTHFACGGEVIVQLGHFNTIVGKYSGGYVDSGENTLKLIRD